MFHLQIFRLLRLLRIFSLYLRFAARRDRRLALQGLQKQRNGLGGGEDQGLSHYPGRTVSGNDNTTGPTLIELEIQLDQNQDTRVGQRLQGEKPVAQDLKS